jgi:hypothetical protein
MTENEELKLKIEYLEDRLQCLELRLANALTYIEYVLPKQWEKKDETLGKTVVPDIHDVV